MGKIYITEELRRRGEQISAMLPPRLKMECAAENRTLWEKARKTLDYDTLRKRAIEIAAGQVSILSEEAYFAHQSSGNSKEADRVLFTNMRNLELLCVAECIENQGEFLPAIEAYMDSFCTMRTWVRPGHDSAFGYAGYQEDAGLLDLYACSLGWRLAIVLECLEGHLSMAAKSQLRETIGRRVVRVYQNKLNGITDPVPEGSLTPLYWLDQFDNWLSVCLSCVTGACLMLGDRQDAGLYIAVYEKLIRNYEKSLADGYCVEGLSYWGYGLSKTFSASYWISRFTKGGVDILSASDVFQKAMNLGQDLRLSGKDYPSVADCCYGEQPDDFCMYFADLWQGRKSEVNLKDFYRYDLYILLTALNLEKKEGVQRSSLRSRTYYPTAGCCVMHDDVHGLSLFTKGGSNHEPHNHNDLGSFVLSSGGVQYIADLGYVAYGNDTFSEKRYETAALSSWGHSVPMVMGQLQGPSKFLCGNYETIRYKAYVVETEFSPERDRIVYQLAEAYDCKELKSLTREFLLDRLEGRIQITDQVEYTKPGSYEAAFTTLCQVMITSGGFDLLNDSAGVQVHVDRDLFDLTIAPVKEIVIEDQTRPLYPLRVALVTKKPLKTGKFQYEIKPLKT